MQVTMCDRCKRSLKFQNVFRYRQFRLTKDRELEPFGEYIELCQDCNSQLARFLDSPEGTT